MPAFSTDLHQEGLILPPTPLDERLVTLIAANSRNLTSAVATFARSWRRSASPSGGSRSSWRGEAENVSSGRWTSCTATPSGRCARASQPCPTAGTTSDVIEAVDGDLEIRVAVSVTGDVVDIDFAGTASQHAGNLNCPLAVTRSACFFVVRVVTDPTSPRPAARSGR